MFYSNTKIHAVNYITNPTGPTAPPVSHPQTLATGKLYTILKTASITEGGLPEKFHLRAGLWADQNGIIEPSIQMVTKYKYYFGDYEKRTQSNSTTAKFIYYVSNGSNLVAILWRNGTPPKYNSGAVTIHYVHIDHLGSLLTLTNQAGVVEAEQTLMHGAATGI